jgi:hypothetical protein
MATFNDPIKCFAPLEVLERLLEIRKELGFRQTVYLPSSNELAKSLDAYGFTGYAFRQEASEINFGDYRTPLVPGGEYDIGSVTAH